MALGLDFHDFVIKNLSNDYYIYCIANQYYIENSPTYQKEHSMHDVLIYGYDEQTQMYSIMVYDKNMMYTSQDISYKLLEKAFKDNYKDKKAEPWTDRILIFKYRGDMTKHETDLNYEFNLDLVKLLIQEYLSGKNQFDSCNRFLNPHNKRVYGMAIYEVIVHYTDLVFAYKPYDLPNTEKLQYDERITCLLKEHKELMLERLKYIKAHYAIQMVDLIAAYEKAAKLAQQALLLTLKYNMTNNKDVVLRLKFKIQELEAIDKKVLTKLLARI